MLVFRKIFAYVLNELPQSPWIPKKKKRNKQRKKTISFYRYFKEYKQTHLSRRDRAKFNIKYPLISIQKILETVYTKQRTKPKMKKY